MCLDVLLKFGEQFGFRILMPYVDILRAVVAYDAAPEGVVHIKGERLLVLAVNRLDYVRKVESKLRDGRNCNRILVSVPVARIRPFLYSVDSRDVVDVMNKEILVTPCVIVETLVEPVDEIEPSVDIGYIRVAHESVIRLLEIVLDNGAVEFLIELFPDLRKTRHCLVRKCFYCLGAVAYDREV